MTVSDNIRAQAEALLALEGKANLERLLNKTSILDTLYGDEADFLSALRNDGPPLIRALLEQVKYVQGLYDNEIANANKHDNCVEERDRRIAALEADLARARAERDLLRIRLHRARNLLESVSKNVPLRVDDLADPTPSEIAARVAQNRKEESTTERRTP